MNGRRYSWYITDWLSNENVFAVRRSSGTKSYLCAVNPRKEIQTLEVELLPGEQWNPDAIVLREGVCVTENGSRLKLTLEPYAYLITEL